MTDEEKTIILRALDRVCWSPVGAKVATDLNLVAYDENVRMCMDCGACDETLVQAYIRRVPGPLAAPAHMHDYNCRVHAAYTAVDPYGRVANIPTRPRY